MRQTARSASSLLEQARVESWCGDPVPLELTAFHAASVPAGAGITIADAAHGDMLSAVRQLLLRRHWG
jgi:hypothetical protein